MPDGRNALKNKLDNNTLKYYHFLTLKSHWVFLSVQQS